MTLKRNGIKSCDKKPRFPGLFAYNVATFCRKKSLNIFLVSKQSIILNRTSRNGKTREMKSLFYNKRFKHSSNNNAYNYSFSYFYDHDWRPTYTEMEVGGTVQRLNTMQYNELSQLETCWFSYFLLIESTKDQGMNNGKSPRSRQTAEIYARSCKAQCFTSLLRLGLVEQFFFG